jgi:hypothetical protein
VEQQRQQQQQHDVAAAAAPAAAAAADFGMICAPAQHSGFSARGADCLQQQQLQQQQQQQQQQLGCSVQWPVCLVCKCMPPRIVIGV